MSRHKTHELWEIVVSIWWSHIPREMMTEQTLRVIAKAVHGLRDVTYNPATGYHEIGLVAIRRQRMLQGPMIVPDEPECLVANWGNYA